MRKLSFLLLFAVIAVQSFAVGQWREYLSYNSAQKVIATAHEIFCITEGGMFRFDKDDSSLQKLNVISGLSDVSATTFAYAADLDVLVVAYDNSNIDLVFSNEVYNMSDILRANIVGEKRVNNILIVEHTAYLSCSFGIVAINLARREVQDTYYIGDNASMLQVNDMTFDGSYLYAATEQGIFRADIQSTNLQYYGNWEKQSGFADAEGPVNQVEYFNGRVVANASSGYAGGDRLYSFDGNMWNRYLTNVSTVQDVQVSGDRLVVAQDQMVEVYNANSQLETRINSYSFATGAVDRIYGNSAMLDSDGYLWIADGNYSLVRVSGSSAEQIQPEGPAGNMVFSMEMNGADLWITDGGRTAAWNNIFQAPRFQLLRNDNWTNFDQSDYLELSGFHDLVCVAVDPTDADHVYAGAWGGGVLEFEGRSFTNRYTQNNSSLQTALPSQPNEPYVRISDMAFDSRGNLWVVNSIVDEPLSVLRANGEWESFRLPGISSSTDVGPLVVADNDDLWITIPRNQNTMLVRRADGTSSRNLTVTAYFYNGENEVYTPMPDIYSIARDKDGAIWFGTGIGVGVYYSPGDIWNSSDFYCSRPGLDEGDGLYHPLLSTQTVTAIAVDGANRKWFGTRTSGVFLISEDGTEEIHHFSTNNSPLLSDEITSLAINDETGELFIGTAKGLISYMGDATSGRDSYSDVYAYPNPVREDYVGDVVITGLMDNTDIKITDISGNLVYKTTSLGGQATWDGKNQRGNRVKTGVYLVFGNDRFGEESFVTKILFIH